MRDTNMFEFLQRGEISMFGWLCGDSSSNNSKSSNEVFMAKQRADGKTDTFFGKSGSNNHGHAVCTENGEVVYLRDTDGTVITDKK